PALLAGDVADSRRVERVGADGNRDTRGDGKRTRQAVEIVRVGHARDVAVGELDLEQSHALARVQAVLIVGHVVEARLRRDPPEVAYRGRSEVVARLREVAPHVGSAHEADL